MKKQILSACMAMILSLGLTVPAFAWTLPEPEPETDEKIVWIKKVEIAFDAVSIGVNHTRILMAFVTPQNATDTGIIWSTSNPEIVDVDAEGTITGISPGTATITASADERYSKFDTITDTCVVTVTDSLIQDPDTITAKRLGGLTVDNADIPNSQFNQGEVVTAASIKPLVEEAVKAAPKGTPGSVVLADRTSISPAALSAASFSAAYAGGTVRLKLTTTDGDGIQGQLTVDPALAENLTADIGTAIYTTGEKTTAVQNHFAGYYTNQMAVITCGQQGAYGMSVGIAAKVNLAGLDTSALLFYAYSTADNTYTLVENQTYTVDGDYLHFTTQNGGSYIITDSALTAK